MKRNFQRSYKVQNFLHTEKECAVLSFMLEIWLNDINLLEENVINYLVKL